MYIITYLLNKIAFKMQMVLATKSPVTVKLAHSIIVEV